MHSKEIGINGENVSIGLSRMEIQLSEGTEDEINKVIFIGTLGQITYKPLIEKKVMVKGFTTIRKVKASILNIPEKLKEINEALNKYGTIEVLATFQEWEKDGNIYRFVQGSNMIDKWSIVKKETEVMEVN